MVSFSSYPADPRPRRAAEALLKEGMSVDFLCLEDEGAPTRERFGMLDIRRLPVRHRRRQLHRRRCEGQRRAVVACLGRSVEFLGAGNAD